MISTLTLANIYYRLLLELWLWVNIPYRNISISKAWFISDGQNSYTNTAPDGAHDDSTNKHVRHLEVADANAEPWNAW